MKYFKVEKILKGSLAHSAKIQIMVGKVCSRCKREYIAVGCQQTFENKKFVDITQ